MTIAPGISPIRALAQGAPAGSVSLALGEPGWALPDLAREALAALPPGLPLGYGPNGGLPELVEAIGAYAAEPAARVMVTTGSQAALFALLTAHLSADAPVLVPDPGFPSYPTLARLRGARTVRYPLGPGGRLDADALTQTLEQAAAGGTAPLVLLNHPGNPTGGGASLAALEQVADACARHGAVLVSDEVYRELTPPGMAPMPSVREASQEAVVLGSVSKAWGAPGLRVGWATGPEALLAPARTVHTAMVTAPARPSQLAATALLRASAAVLPAAREQVARRWAAARPRLPGHAEADGGFYAWLPVPTSAGGDADRFALRARDHGRVVVVPGTVFGPGGAGFVRVSVGGPLAELEEGLARLLPLWESSC